MEKEAQPKLVVKSVDMEPEMFDFVVQAAKVAKNDYASEKEISSRLKQQLEDRFQPLWHVIVGRNFGAYVTHEQKHFAYFYIGQCGFLIFKTA